MKNQKRVKCRDSP